MWLVPWWLVPLVALVAFWPCLSGGLVYDDWVNFDRNHALRERDWWALSTSPYYGPDTTYWRPITSVAMGVAYLAGPFGVHLLALLAHVLAAWTVGAIGWRLGGDATCARSACLLFLLHPLQVESVAWGSALPGVLGGLFVLLTVHEIVRWSVCVGARWPWLAGCWLLCALLAKESAVVALPLVACAAWGGLRSLTARLVVCGAAAAMIAAWFAWRVGMVGWRPVVGDGEHWLVGAAWMTVRQVGLLLAPWPMTPFRAHPNATGDDVLDLVAVAVAAALLVVAAVALVGRRGSAQRRLATALLGAPLLLAAGLYDAVGPHPLTDRHLYLSVGGLALFVAVACRRRIVVLAVILVTHGAMTWQQCHVWRDDATFAAHVAAVSPHEPCVHVLVGTQALRAGGSENLRRAREAYRDALGLVPHRLDDFARRQRAAAIAGLAWCDFSDPAQVVGPGLLADFRAALNEDATYVPAWVGVGVALGLLGRFEAAVEALQKALSIDPRCPEAWFNLAQTRLDMGQPGLALADVQQALRCSPGLEPAQRLLAQLSRSR